MLNYLGKMLIELKNAEIGSLTLKLQNFSAASRKFLLNITFSAHFHNFSHLFIYIVRIQRFSVEEFQRRSNIMAYHLILIFSAHFLHNFSVIQ